jgi:hypothetical protein
MKSSPGKAEGHATGGRGAGVKEMKKEKEEKRARRERMRSGQLNAEDFEGQDGIRSVDTANPRRKR